MLGFHPPTWIVSAFSRLTVLRWLCQKTFHWSNFQISPSWTKIINWYWRNFKLSKIENWQNVRNLYVWCGKWHWGWNWRGGRNHHRITFTNAVQVRILILPTNLETWKSNYTSYGQFSRIWLGKTSGQLSIALNYPLQQFFFLIDGSFNRRLN